MWEFSARPGNWFRGIRIKILPLPTSSQRNSHQLNIQMSTSYGLDLSGWEDFELRSDSGDEEGVAEAKHAERGRRSAQKRAEKRAREEAERKERERAAREAALRAAEEAKRGREKAEARAAKGKVSTTQAIVTGLEVFNADFLIIRSLA